MVRRRRSSVRTDQPLRPFLSHACCRDKAPQLLAVQSAPGIGGLPRATTVTLSTLCDTLAGGSSECRIVSKVSEPLDNAAKASAQRLMAPSPTGAD